MHVLFVSEPWLTSVVINIEYFYYHILLLPIELRCCWYDKLISLYLVPCEIQWFHSNIHLLSQMLLPVSPKEKCVWYSNGHPSMLFLCLCLYNFVRNHHTQVLGFLFVALETILHLVVFMSFPISRVFLICNIFLLDT